MFENSPKQPATEQEPQMKSYKSSLDQVVDYLEQRTNEMRQRRLESKEQTLEEIATNVGDLFRGFNFFKEKGASLKTIGKETINNILKNLDNNKPDTENTETLFFLKSGDTDFRKPVCLRYSGNHLFAKRQIGFSLAVPPAKEKEKFSVSSVPLW